MKKGVIIAAAPFGSILRRLYTSDPKLLPAMPDYFEMDRLVEDLAKIYSTACATSWFKITGNKRPTREEFRGKVVEFMGHFERTLASFPPGPATDQFRDHARKSLEGEIARVLAGENKEVEKRYKYYVDYS